MNNELLHILFISWTFKDEMDFIFHKFAAGTFLHMPVSILKLYYYGQTLHNTLLYYKLFINTGVCRFDNSLDALSLH
jgi:hypothetical protein